MIADTIWSDMVDKPYKRMRMPSELDQPMLSADLEWMLSSSQVSKEFILETLVRGNYASMLRLAQILLNDEKRAERVVRETVESVIRNRHRYHNQTGVEVWLFQLILEFGRLYIDPIKGGQSSEFTPALAASEGIQFRLERDLWQALDELSYPTRLLVCLYYLFGLTSVEIAQVLAKAETTIQAQLNDTRRWLRLCRPQGVPDGEAAENWARESLGRRWPQRDLDEAGQDKIIGSFLHQIDQGDRHKKKITVIQQALSTVAIVVLVALTGWMSSSFLRTRPSVASKAPSTPSSTTSSLMASATAEEGLLSSIEETLAPQVLPLNLSSSIDEIRQRMFISRSLWKQAWVDALLIRYGPPGYVGPALVYRNQMWISNPRQEDPNEHHLVISGLVFDDPNYALYTQGQDVYTVDLRSSVQYTYPRGDKNPIHDLASPVHQGMYGYDQRGMLDGSYLSDMLYSAGLVSSIGDLEILEQNKYLDRDILILTNELQNGITEQLMVDTVTGMVLNWLGYLTSDPDTALAEIIVLNLELEATFPEDAISSTFFWREPITWVDRGEVVQMESFSAQALASALLRMEINTTRPRVTDRIPAPPGYDPSNSCLTFQWPEETQVEGGEEYSVEIFADSYYIGETVLSDPWQILCERSTGGHIACLRPPSGLRNRLFAPSSLSWFELSKPTERHAVLPGAVYLSSDFAFSPDSRFLAFWACLGRREGCGVYLHDTQNHETALLTPLENGATFFVWSPDNKYLAFVGAGANLQYPSSLLVVDVQTGEILDEGAFLWPELSLPLDSPVREWGVKFPPVQGEFEACNQPASK